VEDEPTVRSLALGILSDAGFVTIEAANAAQALMFSQNKRSTYCSLMFACREQ
jgi:CheY-like chemotaxis protein